MGNIEDSDDEYDKSLVDPNEPGVTLMCSGLVSSDAFVACTHDEHGGIVEHTHDHYVIVNIEGFWNGTDIPGNVRVAFGTEMMAAMAALLSDHVLASVSCRVDHNADCDGKHGDRPF